jgi:hypothetical protein
MNRSLMTLSCFMLKQGPSWFPNTFGTRDGLSHHI